MTREEAIERIKSYKRYLMGGNPIWSVEEVAKAFDMAIEALSAERTGWIPVSERLPLYGEKVIVCTRNNRVAMSYCFVQREGFFSDVQDCVLAWMPLPEPYKGGDAE